MLTIDQLVKIMPYAKKRAPLFIGALNETMHEFEIDGIERMACFLAQVGHESGQLQYVEELASGDAYEHRKDLGNTWPGDGRTYKGHGLIQVTGRNNHIAVADYFGKPLEEIVAWLKTPEGATRSAGWFWKTHNCNKFADEHDFRGLTRKINGGYNGWADRLELYEQAKKVLSAP
jgi:putative chitinase